VKSINAADLIGTDPRHPVLAAEKRFEKGIQDCY